MKIDGSVLEEKSFKGMGFSFSAILDWIGIILRTLFM